MLTTPSLTGTVAKVLLLLTAGFVGVGSAILISTGRREPQPSAGPPTVAEAMAALELEPASPYRWIELAEGLLEQRQLEKARFCFERAVELGPHAPPILIRATNFYILMRETGPVLTYTGRVLRLTPAYDELIFRYYDDFFVDIDDTLKGIGSNERAAQSYLRHAIRRNDPQAAQRIWEHLANLALDDKVVSDYAGFLLRSGEPHRAAAVWASHFGQATGDYLNPNRVYNGGFESEPTGLALDWRITDVPGVVVRRDASARREGAHSLRVRFPGTGNLHYRHVTQTVSLSPGRYRLVAWMKAHELTTDQGVYVEIADGAEARTEPIKGTQDWTRREVQFEVPRNRSSVTVRVARSPSRRFDNEVSGTVWLDAVAVVPVN